MFTLAISGPSWALRSFIFVLTKSVVVYKELANSVYVISSCLEYVKKVPQITIFFQQIVTHSLPLSLQYFKPFAFSSFDFSLLLCIVCLWLFFLCFLFFCFANTSEMPHLEVVCPAHHYSSCLQFVKLSCEMVLFRLYKCQSNIWNESNFVCSCNKNSDENLLWNRFHPARFFSFWIFIKF